MSKRKNIARPKQNLPPRGATENRLPVQREYEYSGPLPVPKHLAEYDKVVPGAGDRIIRMAERQSEHVISFQNRMETNKYKEFRSGQILAFSLGVFGISCAVALGLDGQGIAAIGLGFAGVSSMMAQFFRR